MGRLRTYSVASIIVLGALSLFASFGGSASASTLCDTEFCSVVVDITPDGPNYGTVDVTASAGTGGGSCSSNDNPCTIGFPNSYGTGGTITLTANGGSAGTYGYSFDSWGGDCAGQSNPCVLSADANSSVTANFVPNYLLTVSVTDPSGSNGSVNSTPGGIKGCRSTRGTCSAAFPSGRSITLTATPPDSTYRSQWVGCDSTSGNTCTVTMSSDRSVSVTFVKQWTLTVGISPSGGGSVVSNPGGISCPSACSAKFDNGATVTLTATNGNGYVFDHWSSASDCNGSTSPTCNVSMNADKSVTANFARVFTLNVTVSGGGRVTGPGIDCPGDCTEQVRAGTSVTLSEDPRGNAFVGWGDACASAGTQPTCTLTINGNTSVTASFTGVPPTFTLTASVDGKGSIKGPGINCPGDCSETAQAGTTFSLTAQAETGYSFVGWTGACASAGSTPTCNLTLNSDTAVGAKFAQNPTTAETYTISVNVSGSGTVSCKPGPCEQKYPKDTSVRLDAAPAPGFNFAGWDGNCPDAPVSCTVVMDGSKVVTARFTTDPVIADVPKPAQPEPAANSVNVSVSGNGTVKGSAQSAAGFGAAKEADSASINCGVQGLSCFAESSPGSSVRLTANAAAGYAFRGWDGACKGTSPTCRLLLSQVRFVTAKFTPKNPARTVTTVVRKPAFNVRWKASVGTGSLLVSGQVSKKATLTLQLRRQLRGQTTSGELFTMRRGVSAGSFSLRQKLPSQLFRRGARLLPGGFIVSLKGAARGYTVPLQIRTTQLKPPREGVVRLSYMSTSEDGSAVSALSGGAKQGFAIFHFESQPKTNDLQVRWFFPNGKLLDFKQKTNRPVIATELSSNRAIPAGKWHVELWAAGRLVKRQTVNFAG